MIVESRYLDGSYLNANPDWDRGDSSWKADLVAKLLMENRIIPEALCEVGCGSGDILINLSVAFPESKMTGFDISPQAAAFWKDHPRPSRHGSIEFFLADFLTEKTPRYDVLMLLDVFEHVRDPFTFLESCRLRADHFVFHVPLDLSAFSVVRKSPLLEARRKVGHLHFYTKELALATLRECGYDLIQWGYTGAGINVPGRTWKSRLASFPRRVAYAVNKDFGVRLLGGETLLVLAKPAVTPNNPGDRGVRGAAF